MYLPIMALARKDQQQMPPNVSNVLFSSGPVTARDGNDGCMRTAHKGPADPVCNASKES